MNKIRFLRSFIHLFVLLFPVSSQAILVSHLDQPIDQSRPKKSATFKQRYFLDSKYAEGPNSPVLFVICGEWECSSEDLEGTVEQLAKKFGAHLVALEHRYYGKSLPFSKLTVENLAFLKTENVLRDLARFQNFATEHHSLRGKWVAVGYSYAGNLAAYYRVQHPELIAGAIASSAPVEAKTDFTEWNDHIAKVVGETCFAALRSESNEIGRFLTVKPKSALKMRRLFEGMENLLDPSEFVLELKQRIDEIVFDGRRVELCKSLEYQDKNSRLNHFAAVINRYPSRSFETKSGKFENEIEALDPWAYQQCTEYGFFVDNLTPDTALSKYLNSPYGHELFCWTTFGLQDPPKTHLINRKYYEPIISGKIDRILFVNGTEDPYSRLSVSRERGNHVNSSCLFYTVENGNHCADFSEIDPYPELKKMMFEALNKWFY